MSNLVECPNCQEANLQLIKNLNRSEECNDVAIERYICLDCEQTLDVQYSLEVMSIVVEE